MYHQNTTFTEKHFLEELIMEGTAHEIDYAGGQSTVVDIVAQGCGGASVPNDKSCAQYSEGNKPVAQLV